ncbi:MAG: chloride channel protein [Oscillatoriales cyanobacterium C42_A2020_001]|nr:chloride channel protein [Leptolyngbyaceae cyanobacterium C42_A2020_001]
MLPPSASDIFSHLLKPKRLAILEAVLIGLVAAFAAVLLKQGVHWLSGWRVKESLLMPAWLLLPLVGLVGGFLTGLLLERFAPEATGSGVPQVKAALAYIPIPLDLRVAVVKILSTMLALGSGLVLGRQGPTVQIGAALAAQMSRWVPSSPDHQRQLIAAGAAAGLAAGFDAPIAGVLFVIEELLHDVSSLTLGTAILASFTGGVVSRVLAGPSLSLGLDPFISNRTSFSPQEIPFLLLLGILAGVFAAFFNRSIVNSLRLTRRYVQFGLPWKIGLAGLISGGMIAMLPPMFRDTNTLQSFLTLETTSWGITAGAFLVQFVLSILACSAEAPGGLFIPSLVLGAALGKLVGLGAANFGDTDPILYALTGMGAFFGAVAKVPITAIVIVFEITINYNLILPLMISAVTAYLVAERLAPGSLYTHLLELKGIHLEPDAINDGLWAKLSAAEVMQTKVETLDSRMSIDEVVAAFSNSHHRGFPVVDDRRLVGIVTQTDLDKVSQRQLPGTALLQEIMTPKPITVTPGDTLGRVLYLLSHYKLSRLPVVEHRKLVGIITRSDILRVEADKLRGDSDKVGPQPEPSYVVYQTRSPAIGQGRILLPLSNPKTADALMKLALSVAREFNYEIECLRIIPVSRHHSPSESVVTTTLSRRLLMRAVQQGKAWQVPVHTQIRAAHTVAEAVLETVKERHIDLLLMGWKGNTSTPGRIFGDTVDTVIRQADCDVVLVKMGEQVSAIAIDLNGIPETSVQATLQLSRMNRWLLPMGGGPNAEYAVKLLPALVAISQQPRIRLCHIYHPWQEDYDPKTLEEDAAFLRHKSQGIVEVTPVCANSVVEAVVDMAQKDQCDVIVLGASREGMLQQAIHGNIPETIARNSKCTVILVRKAIA